MKTGNYRVRQSWNGKLILQMEETFANHDPHGFGDAGTHTEWRDMKVTDLRTNFPIPFVEVMEAMKR